MSTARQIEMFMPAPSDAEVEELLRTLRSHGWLTRKALNSVLGWTDRRIRSVAEAAGSDVVRGPRGFNAFEGCSLDEIEHCAAIAEGQGKKMVDYALALRRRAHGRMA